MAEGVFNDLIEKEKLSHKVTCDSAGTSNYHIGERADRRTLQVLDEKGIALPHLGRQLQLSDFDNFDYILAMDANNYDDINRLAQNKNDYKAKVLLMRYFDASQSEKDVPDPYYGGIEGFYEVYHIVKDASEGLIKFLKQKHKI